MGPPITQRDPIVFYKAVADNFAQTHWRIYSNTAELGVTISQCVQLSCANFTPISNDRNLTDFRVYEATPNLVLFSCLNASVPTQLALKKDTLDLMSIPLIGDLRELGMKSIDSYALHSRELQDVPNWILNLFLFFSTLGRMFTLLWESTTFELAMRPLLTCSPGD